MAYITDKTIIYIAKPTYITELETETLNGYDNLKSYENIKNAPAYDEISLSLYGGNINNVIKFHDEHGIIDDIDNDYALYFEKPIDLTKADYLINNVRKIGKVTTFDGVKIQN